MRHKATSRADAHRRGSAKADDGTRTRYLELGKLALYQVSYVRGEAKSTRGAAAAKRLGAGSSRGASAAQAAAQEPA